MPNPYQPPISDPPPTIAEPTNPDPHALHPVTRTFLGCVGWGAIGLAFLFLMSLGFAMVAFVLNL